MLTFYDRELTPRENEVLRHLLSGKKSNADIAKCMGVAVSTVNKHIENIRFKKEVVNTRLLILHYSRIMQNQDKVNNLL